MKTITKYGIRTFRLMLNKKLVLILVVSIAMLNTYGQTDKRIILADKYYAAGDYLTAASLYGQFLHPVKVSKAATGFPLNNNRNAEGLLPKGTSKTDIIFKQAHSYRLANYYNEAILLYKDAFAKDNNKYAESLFWLATIYRSLGNISAAEEFINRFISDYPASTNYTALAEKEKHVIKFNKIQLVRPDTGLYHVQKLNSSFGPNYKGVFAALPLGENQFIVTSTQKDSVAEDINPYYNRLFKAGFGINGIDHVEPLEFASPELLPNQGTATITQDGKRLYFTQWKKENGKLVSAIYYSNKTNNGWSKPIAAGSVNKMNSNSLHPFIAPGGQYIYFSSDREGGYGKLDIWYAPLNNDGTTAQPVNAGNVINSDADEQAPFLHAATGTMIFASDRLPSMGGLDLFMAKGSGSNWKEAENMGHPINSSRDESYFFSTGANLLSNAYLSSDRGSECCLATYTVSKAEKKRMLAGVVYDCKDNQPLSDANVIIRDGDGNVFNQITGEDGKYRFDLVGDSHVLTVQKDKYNEQSSAITVEDLNEANWQADTLFNAAVCIEKKLVIKVENVVTVYFDFDRHDLKNLAVGKLDSIYNVLNADSTYTIQISGYTDGLGSVEYNKILSDKRARACAEYLVQKGLDPNRISFESFGACCPVEMELINGRDNPDGRSMNRRALINIDKE